MVPGNKQNFRSEFQTTNTTYDRKRFEKNINFWANDKDAIGILVYCLIDLGQRYSLAGVRLIKYTKIMSSQWPNEFTCQLLPHWTDFHLNNLSTVDFSSSTIALKNSSLRYFLTWMTSYMGNFNLSGMFLTLQLFSYFTHYLNDVLNGDRNYL